MRELPRYADVRGEAVATGIAMTIGCAIIGVAAVASGGTDGDWGPTTGTVGGVIGGTIASFFVHRDIRRAPRGSVGTVRDGRSAPAAYLAVLLIAGALGTVIDASTTLGLALFLVLALPILLVWETAWQRRLERETGTRAYREVGLRWKQRYVRVPVKDTAPAQRKTAHAQSEAARRAP